MRLRARATICLLFSVSCAARRPSPQLVAELGKADSLLRDGCYACLDNALATYERLANDPRGPIEARRGAFDAAILLSVRAKELGAPAEPFIVRARGHAERLLPDPSRALPASAYLDAAEFIAGDLSGLEPDARQRFRRLASPGGERPPVRTALNGAPATDLVAAYLALAIDCEDGFARQTVRAPDVLARHGRVPLIRFRLALCAIGTDTPASMRAEDRRWTDALFFEGRRELGMRPVADVGKAAGFFADAHAAFPDSTAITLALGNAQNALSEYEPALASFDTVLATYAVHREALLGRVMSLSFLSRHEPAIASASRMIELGTWLMGDAYYWRAWNRFQRQELDPAWIDIEAATKLNVDSVTFMLAGVIAYARKDLETAVNRLDRSFALDNTNCEAIWTEGLVHVDRQAWDTAAPRFSRGMTCFGQAAAQAKADIAEAEKATYAEALRLRRLTAANKRLETAEHRRAQSAFNAAQSYLRLGQKTLALVHVDAAAEHPLLKDKTAVVKSAIEKLPR